MTQFSHEDDKGAKKIVSNSDVIFESDRDQDGSGDLVFRSGGVERARIAADGTATGFGDLLGGYIPAVNLASQYGLSASASAASNGAALEQAIADASAAGESRTLVFDDLYEVDRAFVLPLAQNIRLVAARPGAGLQWGTDLGAGVYGISWGPFADWTQHGIPYQIVGLSLVGPDGTGSPTGTQLGTASALMGGVLLERGCRVVDCRIEGFYSGVAKYGNHQQIVGCVIRNNYINLDYPDLAADDPMIGQNYGDECVARSYLTAARFANISVGQNQGILTALFERNEIGYSPYHLHAKTGRTVGNFISESLFVCNNFEAFGNGFIWAEDAGAVDVINRTVFVDSVGGLGGDGPSVTFTNTYKIAARAQDYAIRLGSIDGLEVRGAHTPWAYPGNVAVIQAGATKGMELHLQRYFDNYGTYGKPLLVPLAAGSQVDWHTNRVLNRNQQFRLGNPGTGATTQGNLMFFGTGSTAGSLLTTTSTRVPAGVVYETTSAPSSSGLHRVLVQTTGNVTSVADGAISDGDYVKPSTTTSGRVITNGTTAAGSIGVALSAAASAGSTLPVRLRWLD